MSLCPHGYTAFFDCPLCECYGCGRQQDLCVCHEEPRPTYHGAAGPIPEIEPAPHRALITRWVQHELEQTDRKASVLDEIAGAAGLVLLLIGAFLALHLA